VLQGGSDSRVVTNGEMKGPFINRSYGLESKTQICNPRFGRHYPPHYAQSSLIRLLLQPAQGSHS
jgi:hypothetical protein